MAPPAKSGNPPSRIPWPPLLIAATLLAGRALDCLLAPPLLPADAVYLGCALVALALLSDVWCARELQRRKTTIMPHRAVSALVTSGPYRYSRNPIYISHVALTLGLALAMRSLSVAALTPLLAAALTRLSVLPEERHLAEKFGPEFAAYAARTPRWL
jgi:protein-S-isoprenylcysteine O-methyltransferase Ste14